MSPVIRRARESDYEQLAPLWRELDAQHARIRPEFFRLPEGKGRPYRFLTGQLGSAARTVLVAEIEGSCIGVVHVSVHDPPDSPFVAARRRTMVADLVVAPEQRRAGIGRALMDAAVRWSREQGAAQVVLSVWEGNEEAVAFYRALGYEPVSHVLGLEL